MAARVNRFWKRFAVPPSEGTPNEGAAAEDRVSSGEAEDQDSSENKKSEEISADACDLTEPESSNQATSPEATGEAPYMSTAPDSTDDAVQEASQLSPTKGSDDLDMPQVLREDESAPSDVLSEALAQNLGRMEVDTTGTGEVGEMVTEEAEFFKAGEAVAVSSELEAIAIAEIATEQAREETAPPTEEHEFIRTDRDIDTSYETATYAADREAVFVHVEPGALNIDREATLFAKDAADQAREIINAAEENEHVGAEADIDEVVDESDIVESGTDVGAEHEIEKETSPVAGEAEGLEADDETGEGESNETKGQAITSYEKRVDCNNEGDAIAFDEDAAGEESNAADSKELIDASVGDDDVAGDIDQVESDVDADADTDEGGGVTRERTVAVDEETERTKTDNDVELGADEATDESKGEAITSYDEPEAFNIEGDAIAVDDETAREVTNAVEVEELVDVGASDVADDIEPDEPGMDSHADEGEEVMNEQTVRVDDEVELFRSDVDVGIEADEATDGKEGEATTYDEPEACNLEGDAIAVDTNPAGEESNASEAEELTVANVGDEIVAEEVELVKSDLDADTGAGEEVIHEWMVAVDEEAELIRSDVAVQPGAQIDETDGVATSSYDEPRAFVIDVDAITVAVGEETNASDAEELMVAKVGEDDVTEEAELVNSDVDAEAGTGDGDEVIHEVLVAVDEEEVKTDTDVEILPDEASDETNGVATTSFDEPEAVNIEGDVIAVDDTANEATNELSDASVGNDITEDVEEVKSDVDTDADTDGEEVIHERTVAVDEEVENIKTEVEDDHGADEATNETEGVATTSDDEAEAFNIDVAACAVDDNVAGEGTNSVEAEELVDGNLAAYDVTDDVKRGKSDSDAGADEVEEMIHEGTTTVEEETEHIKSDVGVETGTVEGIEETAGGISAVFDIEGNAIGVDDDATELETNATETNEVICTSVGGHDVANDVELVNSDLDVDAGTDEPDEMIPDELFPREAKAITEDAEIFNTGFDVNDAAHVTDVTERGANISCEEAGTEAGTGGENATIEDDEVKVEEANELFKAEAGDGGIAEEVELVKAGESTTEATTDDVNTGKVNTETFKIGAAADTADAASGTDEEPNEEGFNDVMYESELVKSDAGKDYEGKGATPEEEVGEVTRPVLEEDELLQAEVGASLAIEFERDATIREAMTAGEKADAFNTGGDTIAIASFRGIDSNADDDKGVEEVATESKTDMDVFEKGNVENDGDVCAEADEAYSNGEGAIATIAEDATDDAEGVIEGAAIVETEIGVHDSAKESEFVKPGTDADTRAEEATAEGASGVANEGELAKADAEADALRSGGIEETRAKANAAAEDATVFRNEREAIEKNGDATDDRTGTVEEFVGAKTGNDDVTVWTDLGKPSTDEHTGTPEDAADEVSNAADEADLAEADSHDDVANEVELVNSDAAVGIREVITAEATEKSREELIELDADASGNDFNVEAEYVQSDVGSDTGADATAEEATEIVNANDEAAIVESAYNDAGEEAEPVTSGENTAVLEVNYSHETGEDAQAVEEANLIVDVAEKVELVKPDLDLDAGANAEVQAGDESGVAVESTKLVPVDSGGNNAEDSTDESEGDVNAATEEAGTCNTERQTNTAVDMTIDEANADDDAELDGTEAGAVEDGAQVKSNEEECTAAEELSAGKEINDAKVGKGDEAAGMGAEEDIVVTTSTNAAAEDWANETDGETTTATDDAEISAVFEDKADQVDEEIDATAEEAELVKTERVDIDVTVEAEFGKANALTDSVAAEVAEATQLDDKARGDTIAVPEETTEEVREETKAVAEEVRLLETEGTTNESAVDATTLESPFSDAAVAPIAIKPFESKEQFKGTESCVAASESEDDRDEDDTVNDSPTPTLFYSLEALIKGVEGVEFATREQYLSPEDFQVTFGMTKGDFNAMRKWRRQAAKKKVGLF